MPESDHSAPTISAREAFLLEILEAQNQLNEQVRGISVVDEHYAFSIILAARAQATGETVLVGRDEVTAAVIKNDLALAETASAIATAAHSRKLLSRNTSQTNSASPSKIDRKHSRVSPAIARS